MGLFLNLQEAKNKIDHFKNPDANKQAYIERVKQGQELKEIEQCYTILYKINETKSETTEGNFNVVVTIVDEYKAFCVNIIPTEIYEKRFKPIIDSIFIFLKEKKQQIIQSKSGLTVSLSAATNINEALDNVQSIVQFYGDPNNMEAFQKLQKNDKQAVLQIYNTGKDFLKYSKDIDKNNLKRAQEAYSAYLKLLDDIPGSYSRYFEPLAEQLGKALVEKEDELSPQQGTKPPSQPSAAGGTSQSIPSAAKPPTSIPSGPVKPIGVTGMGTPNAGKKPAPKKDYKTLLATDDRGGSLYFVRIGPGNYRPAVQADKDAGVQLFARNPNPAARMVYPFIKIQNMPTRRASPI